MEFKITGDVYAQSKEEFKNIKIAALKAGYKAKEMTSHPERKATGAGQFLTLEAPRYERKGKCGYCNTLIDIMGIYSHGRKCENCGKTIYQKYERGGLVSFYFRNFKEGALDGLFADVTLRIHSFDIDQKILRFELNIPRQAKYGNQNRKRVLEIMEKNKDAYNIITIGKKKVYSFYYPFNGMMNELTRINTSEVKNRKGGYPSGPRNCSVVQILDGIEYSEHASYSGLFSELPMPTSFHIYRDWKVEKTIQELCRRANISSRPEYYSGRSEGDISSDQLVKLYKLIKQYKGDQAADNFKEMISGCDDFSATILVKKILKLASADYKWVYKPSNLKEKETNVQLDGSLPNAFGTIMSMMSNSMYGAFVKKSFSEEFDAINGYMLTARQSGIKTNFLKQIDALVK